MIAISAGDHMPFVAVLLEAFCNLFIVKNIRDFFDTSPDFFFFFAWSHHGVVDQSTTTHNNTQQHEEEQLKLSINSINTLF